MSTAAPRLVFAVTTDLSYDQRMQRICGSLARAGYEVLLVGWQRPASVPLGPQPYAQHRLRGWFQHGKLFYLEYNLRLLLYLLDQRAAAWACADLDAALPTWLRARLGGQPFVYDAHELFTQVPEVVARPRVQRLWQGVENFIVPRARLRYTVGPALARLFEEKHPGYPFGVVRNVPLADSPPSLPLSKSSASRSRSFWFGYKSFWSKSKSSSPEPRSLNSGLKSYSPKPESPNSGYRSPNSEIKSFKSDYKSYKPDYKSCKPDYKSYKPDYKSLSSGSASLSVAAAGSLTAWPAILLYQGALNVGRGLAELLDALPQVPARLVICGEGDCSAALRAQAARLGLLASGQVEFKGYVLPEALRQLTAQATVGIMLLENTGLSYYYSLANKFFDYVQAGIPQLCIDFPEYRALNARHEVAALVPDLAPATLAAALARLLPGGRPGAYHAQLAAHCRPARLEWSWQQEEKILIKMYDNLLNAGNVKG